MEVIKYIIYQTRFEIYIALVKLSKIQIWFSEVERFISFVCPKNIQRRDTNVRFSETKEPSTSHTVTPHYGDWQIYDVRG